MSYQPFPGFTDWRVQFDSSVVDLYAERLTDAKRSASPEDIDRALETATRYAAVDTGAIEGLYTTDRGFTETIAQQTEFWQQALDQREPHVRRSIEDALRAYDYVLDATTGSRPITQQWIRELHSTITRSQRTYEVRVPLPDGSGMGRSERPLEGGKYKTDPNNPTNEATGRIHHYAPPEDTEAEMGRLVDQLRSVEFRAAHPVVQASYAHYAYVCVHPFPDGNGRVARALASVFLYRTPGVPLVVFADQRALYLDALEAADDGDPTQFVSFINDRVVDAVGLVTATLRARPHLSDSQAVLEREVAAWAEESLVLAGRRVVDLCKSALQEELDGRALPNRLNTQVNGGELGLSPYGDPGSGPNDLGWIHISCRLDPVGNTAFVHRYQVVLDTALKCVRVTGDLAGEDLTVFPREVDPTESTAFRLRLSVWAKAVVEYFIDELATDLRASLGSVAANVLHDLDESRNSDN